jgi:hypothetical protein
MRKPRITASLQLNIIQDKRVGSCMHGGQLRADLESMRE